MLHLPLTALFCSRKCPGDAILRAYDLARELRERQTPVIGGFHTPVEKDMLEILLKGKGPIVYCQARGLEGSRIAAYLRGPLEDGRLLICSIAPEREKCVTAETALERNRLVAALAADWQFVYVEPGGNLERLSRECASRRC